MGLGICGVIVIASCPLHRHRHYQTDLFLGGGGSKAQTFILNCIVGTLVWGMYIS